MSHHAHYPRPEYPRPDKQRGTLEGLDWLNLNGPWRFRFDGENRGLHERWYETGDACWHEQIIVPFCWESLAAWGEGNAASSENYYSTRVFRNPLEVDLSNHRTAPRYEVGWYQRDIRVPKDWLDGRRVILHIGAADYFTEAWCNGVYLGGHEGGYTPFEFDITDALQSGKGFLTLRVEDPMDNHEQPVGKQWRWYTTTSGIWQTVFLEPRSLSHIESFRITSDIGSQTAHFEFECRNAKNGAEIEIIITNPVGEQSSFTTRVEEGRASHNTHLDPLFLWDPIAPHLYRVKFILNNEAEASERDVIYSYFGMRELTTAVVNDPGGPGSMILNGRPIYLRGALYQSYYPDGVYTAGDAATLREDLAFAKKAGFQFLRIHIKLDDPLILYYADEMGMLIMEDFPNFGEGGDTMLGRKRFETMMREGIHRDFNHPSIIAWCLFNETWGFGGQVELVKHFGPNAHALLAETTSARIENRSAQQWVQAMWELAKSLDPTRLVEDMSVVHWEHLHYYAHGDTDINSWHFYISDYYKAKEHIEKVVKESYAGSKFNFEEGYAQGHQPLINSEFGGVGALDGDRDVSWSFKFLTNELRRHGSLSAYIYTELHDVEWEYNGLLNYDRTVKEFGYDPTTVNSPDVLPINAPPIKYYNPGEMISIEVASSHFSSIQARDVTLHWRLSGIDSIGRITQDLQMGSKLIPFEAYKVMHAHHVPLVLPEEPMLCTLWIFALNGDGTVLAKNFIKLATSESLPLREEQRKRTIYRCEVQHWAAAEWSGAMCSREDAERTGRCYGFGHGFFEWSIPIKMADLEGASHLRVLCEASARRMDFPQTDSQRYPTVFEIEINGVKLHHAILPDHPHDSRGALSYLNGGLGGYGYLAQVGVSDESLQLIRERTTDGHLHLRCSSPSGDRLDGGLSIYAFRSGRYPVSPTIILER